MIARSSDAVPSGLSLAGARSGRPPWGLAGILAIRLAVLSGILLLLLMFLPDEGLVLYAFIALSYIVTIPYALWLRNHARFGGYIPVQFGVDLLVVTGLVYFTGGADSDLFLLYPLVILSAGIVTTPGRALQITVLCIIVYVLLVTLLAQGILVPMDIRPFHSAGSSWGQSLVVRCLALVLFGWVSVFLARRCHYVDHRVDELRSVMEAVFANLPSGLLLADAHDRILYANSHACSLLGCDDQRLRHLPARSLIGEGITPAPGQGGEPQPCRDVRRPDGSSFPASVAVSRIVVDSAAVVSNVPTETDKGLSIITITDMSSWVVMQQQIQDAGRMKAATTMAAEMAHEIRNPLAAISGSIQLLQQLEKNSFLGDGASTQLLSAERNKLYQAVVSESSRLDRIIEKFIDYAEYSQESLSKLLGIDHASITAKDPEPAEKA